MFERLVIIILALLGVIFSTPISTGEILFDVFCWAVFLIDLFKIQL